MIICGTILALVIVSGSYMALAVFLNRMYGIQLPLTKVGDVQQISNLYDAVAYRDKESFERLMRDGADVNAPNYQGRTPLMIACVINQYVMAEMLIDAGADIWVADKLGFTAGVFISTDLVGQSELEKEAMQRVIQKLEAKGYPWPAPYPGKVLEMKESGEWPPRDVPA